MTPAINLLRKHKVDFTLREYEHNPSARSYGMEAAEKLGLDPARVYKTLIAQLDSGALAVAIVPVSRQLDFKALAKAAGAKKAHMAELALAEKSSGYVAGGVSPLGQKKSLPTYLDQSALGFPTIFVSGGRRGLDVELAPRDLQRLTRAVLAPLTPQAGL